MRVGDKIKSLRKAKGLTQTELGEKVGVKKNAVSKWECGRVEDIPTSMIKALANLFDVPPSYLIDDDTALNIFNIPNIQPMPETKKVPLLGSIACGAPVLAEEHIEGYVEVPSHIHADFTLRCKGDSMINARIFDGDIVYIRQQEEVNSGEIAAVLIDDEATLKRVKLHPDRIILEPANPLYDPLVFRGEEMNNVRILGKAVAFTSIVQ